MDAVEHAEMVEKELGAFIERHSRKGAVDPNEESELWRESLAWCDYFELRVGGVGSCVLRFFGFPDFVIGL